MSNSNSEYFKCLTGGSVYVDEDSTPDSEGHANIVIEFHDGSLLRACYWRIVGDEGTIVSSFDHGKKYGANEPVNAKKMIKIAIENQTVIEFVIDKSVGDITIYFDNRLQLQVFGFTRYEIWDLHFANGRVEYSNHL